MTKLLKQLNCKAMYSGPWEAWACACQSIACEASLALEYEISRL